jgi:hypothetical protein
MRLLAAPAGALLLLLSVPLLAKQPARPRAVRLPRLRAPVLRPPLVGRFGLGGPALAPGLSDQPAQDLFKRMLQAENRLVLAGDQVSTVSRNGLDFSSEEQVQRDGARALRIDYLRPAGLAGEQIIDNGRFYCHLMPAKDTLELSPSRIQSLRVRVPEVIAQIRADRLVVQSMGQDVVAGHACGIVQAAARSSAPVPWRRFWIDPTNGAQLRIEQYGANGRLQSVSYYTQVTYNPRFDAAAFRLPSTGSKVVTSGFATPSLTLDQVRAQAGFRAPAPAYLPEGFQYQAGSVSEARRSHVVELRYFNGANTLSVFETPDGPGTGRAQTEHPRHGVLFGRQAGMKVVLIGNVGNGELEKVLTSLR